MTMWNSCDECTLIDALGVSPGDLVSVGFNAAPVTAVPTASGKIGMTLLQLTMTYKGCVGDHILLSRTSEDGHEVTSAFHIDSIILSIESKVAQASSGLVLPSKV